MKVRTVRTITVATLKGPVVINASDFNPAVHTVFDPAAAAPVVSTEARSAPTGPTPEEFVLGHAADVTDAIRTVTDRSFLQAVREAEATARGRRTVLAAADARAVELAPAE